MLQPYITDIDQYIRTNFPAEIREISVLAYKAISLILLFIILAYLLKKLLLPVIRWTVNKLDRPLYKALYERKVFRAFLNFIPLMFCYFLVEEVFYRSKRYLPYVDMFSNWLIVTIIGQILYRTTKAVEDYTTYQTADYNTTSFKAVGQSIRIAGSLIYVIISLSIFLRVSPGSILAGLGAMTALVLLMFRDSILALSPVSMWLPLNYLKSGTGST